MSGVVRTYPEDSSRVILVVGDTATAQPSLGHDRIQPGVCFHGVAATAAGWLSTHEGVDGRIASVLFLDLSVSLLAHPEEKSTKCCSNDNDTNDNTPNNPCDVGTFTAAGGATCRSGGHVNNAGWSTVSKGERAIIQDILVRTYFDHLTRR